MFVDPRKIVEQFGLTPGMRVADFGCGPGFYTLACARLVGEKGRVYAIDIQEDLLKQLKTEAQREHIENIEIIRGDLEEAGGSTLKEGSVGVVILANTLFQLDEPQKCVDEALRVIEKGGKIFVIDWKESFGGLGPQKENVISQDDARKLFEREGCEITRDINAQNYHYGFEVTCK